MNVIQNLISDLREKRLWPVAVALILALVAVPVLLSGGGGKSGVPVAQIPLVGAAGAAVPALPAVSVTTTPSNARLTGRQRDPFTQQVKASSQSTSSKASATKAKGSSGAKASTGSSKSGTVGGSTTTTTTTTTTTPTTAAAPTPMGLTASQAYHVSISFSSAALGLSTIDPVERLSPLPSDQQPLLIELGVLSGGHRALFVVQPGTLVRGPGRCTPGPIDCEILSLAPNQTEWVGTTGPSGAASVALMAVTGINPSDYASPAAAETAREAASAAGHRLLSKSKFTALSLFQYRPSLGAVVDLSNVTVGGN